MTKPANIPTPPAYNFTSKGLQIEKAGNVVFIEPREYGLIVHAMTEQMLKESRDG